MALFFGKKKKDESEIPLLLPTDLGGGEGLGLQDILAPSALEVNPSFIRIGEKFARTIFVFSYPRYLHTGWFSPIIYMDKLFDISMHIHPVDTATIMRTLRRKTAEVQSQISDREARGLVRDPMLDASYRNLEELRDKLQQAQERLFS